MLFRSRIPRGSILKTATVLCVPDNKFSFATGNFYSHCNRVVRFFLNGFQVRNRSHKGARQWTMSSVIGTGFYPINSVFTFNDH
jgi:hypothetical protein